MLAFIKAYLARHKNVVNRLCHIIGIPLILLSIFQFFTGKYGYGIFNFFCGYLLQWIGHVLFEKNEVGEVILIRSIARKIRKK